jgi:two-component system sensor histidine kinase RpfC
MPVMGGLEAMKIYNFSHRGRRAPWIILTADATRETMEECARSGADGYLTKPINPTVLLARITQVAEVTRQAEILPIVENTPTSEPVLDELILFGSGTTDTATRAVPFIERFQENAINCIERMQSGLLRKDHASVRIACRALESYCTDVGAVRLAKQAGRICSLSEPDLLRNSGDNMHDLVNTYEETIQSLRTFARRRNPKS